MRITHAETVEKNSTMKHPLVNQSRTQSRKQKNKRHPINFGCLLFLGVVVIPCSLVYSVIKDAHITHGLDNFIQFVEP